MAKNWNCLRCGAAMHHLKREKLQLGEHGWVLGDLNHLLHGSLEVDIYCCPDCGKLEFYRTDPEREAEMPQTRCPQCGKLHDVDWPRCPFCKYDYYEQ